MVRCQLRVCSLASSTWPARNDIGSVDLTHLSDLADLSWLWLRGRDNRHHKGLRERRNMHIEKRVQFMRETKKHKMNHSESNGSGARKWEREIGESIQLRLVKYRTLVGLPVYLHPQVRYLMFPNRAPVWTHNCHWRSIIPMNSPQWGLHYRVKNRHCV